MKYSDILSLYNALVRRYMNQYDLSVKSMRSLYSNEVSHIDFRVDEDHIIRVIMLEGRTRGYSGDRVYEVKVASGNYNEQRDFSAPWTEKMDTIEEHSFYCVNNKDGDRAWFVDNREEYAEASLKHRDRRESGRKTRVKIRELSGKALTAAYHYAKRQDGLKSVKKSDIADYIVKRTVHTNGDVYTRRWITISGTNKTCDVIL